jgi:hypothetical protein
MCFKAFTLRVLGNCVGENGARARLALLTAFRERDSRVFDRPLEQKTGDDGDEI